MLNDEKIQIAGIKKKKKETKISEKKKSSFGGREKIIFPHEIPHELAVIFEHETMRPVMRWKGCELGCRSSFSVPSAEGTSPIPWQAGDGFKGDPSQRYQAFFRMLLGLLKDA